MTPRVKVLTVLLAASLATFALAAPQQPAGPPQPGPEHKRLGYFLGKWDSTGEMKAGPWGPAGPVTFTETCEWLAGGFSLVCRSEGTMPGMGQVKGISIMSYNAEEKRYEYYAANSIGMVEHSTGNVSGKVWSWRSQSKMGGKMMKTTFQLTEGSPTGYSYKMSMAEGTAPLAVAMEGKATKAK